MLFRDDRWHVRIIAGGEKSLQGGAERLNKRLFDALVNKQVIRFHTGLAGIEHLAKSNAAGSQLEIGGFIDDDWAFASQLQRHRGQMLCGGLHHHLADGNRTGKEDIVEFFFQQSAVLGAAALNHGDVLRRESLPQQAGDGRRGLRGVRRRLHHDAVAAGDSPNQRRKAELNGIIPR